MKITRHTAIQLFHKLGTMALGHLDDDTLEAVMTDFNAFRKIAEDFEELKKELFKRLYGDLDAMDEADKKRILAFFEIIAKIEKADNKAELETLAKETYPDIYDLRRKELKCIISMLGKEIDVDVVKVDADAFIKGIVKGKKDAPVHEIRAAFVPIFKELERTENDYSELDSLLAEEV